MSIFGQTLGCGQDTSARQRSDHSSTLAIIRKTHWKDANDNDNVSVNDNDNDNVSVNDNDNVSVNDNDNDSVSVNDNDNVSANNRGERGRNGKYTPHCFI